MPLLANLNYLNYTLLKKFIMKAVLVAVLGLSMASCKSIFYHVYDVDYDSSMKMLINY